MRQTRIEGLCWMTMLWAAMQRSGAAIYNWFGHMELYSCDLPSNSAPEVHFVLCPPTQPSHQCVVPRELHILC